MESRALWMMCITLFAWGLLLTKMYQLKVGSAIWTEARTDFGQLPLDFMHEFRQEIGMLQWKCRHVQVWAVSECLLLGVLQGKEGSGWVNHGSFPVVQQCCLPTLVPAYCSDRAGWHTWCVSRAGKWLWLRAHSVSLVCVDFDQMWRAQQSVYGLPWNSSVKGLIVLSIQKMYRLEH